MILQFDKKVAPKRVLKTINFCVVDTQVKIIIQHVEFREYIKNAATKAKEKVPSSVESIITTLLTALLSGEPVIVTLGMLLVVTGIVVLAGALIVSSVKIYTYRGKTRVRLAPAA